MKKFFMFVLVIGVVVLIACGGGDEDDGTVATESEESSLQASDSSDDKSPSTKVDNDTPSYSAYETGGGTLSRLWADQQTLDPHLTGDTTSAGVVVEIFSGLVALNTDLELVPDIAESWDISGMGEVYTFRIRDDVTFHSGRKVMAADFKWSLERAAAP